ncbi:MAG: lyase family protein, partial [Candidatus Limnocylindrus sp.]
MLQVANLCCTSLERAARNRDRCNECGVPIALHDLCADLILAELDALIAVIIRRAREERDTVMAGRTHSVHAEPMTFGAKLA